MSKRFRDILYVYLYISLYQIVLKCTVNEIASQIKRPWKVMEYGNNFCKKKKKKIVGNLATLAVKFTALNSKIDKYGSDFTYFEI